jgi:hypothetical protein
MEESEQESEENIFYNAGWCRRTDKHMGRECTVVNLML